MLQWRQRASVQDDTDDLVQSAIVDRPTAAGAIHHMHCQTDVQSAAARTFAEGHGPEVVSLVLNVCKDVLKRQARSAVVGYHILKHRQVLVAPARLRTGGKAHIVQVVSMHWQH